MGTLNLDALRSEAGLEGHEFIVGGRTFHLPPIMPVGLGSSLTEEEGVVRLFMPDEEVAVDEDGKLCAVDDEGDLVPLSAEVRATLSHLKRHLSIVRSDRPLSEFDDDPQSDMDMICERLYGVSRTRGGDEVPAPNREARRAGPKAKAKKRK